MGGHVQVDQHWLALGVDPAMQASSRVSQHTTAILTLSIESESAVHTICMHMHSLHGESLTSNPVQSQFYCSMPVQQLCSQCDTRPNGPFKQDSCLNMETPPLLISTALKLEVGKPRATHIIALMILLCVTSRWEEPSAASTSAPAPSIWRCAHLWHS